MSDRAFIDVARELGRSVAMIELRGDYVYGRIDHDEFERRVGLVLGLECHHDWIDISSFGGPRLRICSLCSERQDF